MMDLTCPECLKTMTYTEVASAEREKSILLWSCECGFSPALGMDDPWAFCMGCHRYFPPSDNIPYHCPSCNETFKKFGQEVEI